MYASHGHVPAGAVAPPTIAACAREPWRAAAESGNDSPAATPNARLSDQMMHRCRAILETTGYSDPPRAGDFFHHPTHPGVARRARRDSGIAPCAPPRATPVGAGGAPAEANIATVAVDATWRSHHASTTIERTDAILTYCGGTSIDCTR